MTCVFVTHKHKQFRLEVCMNNNNDNNNNLYLHMIVKEQILNAVPKRRYRRLEKVPLTTAPCMNKYMTYNNYVC